jgi:hypothetical protein
MDIVLENLPVRRRKAVYQVDVINIGLQGCRAQLADFMIG